MKDSGRIPWLDVGRGISILLVVYYHVIMMAEIWDIPVAGFYEQLNLPMRAVRMPFFFVMSGLLLASRLDIPWPDYARKYLLPTAWLFLLWNTLYTFTLQVSPIQALSGIVWPGHIDTHLWFLWALLLFRGLSKALRPWAGAAILVVGALSALRYANYLHYPGQPFVEGNLLRYTFFFLGAAWYGRPIANWLTRHPVLGAVGAALAFTLCWAFKLRMGIAVSGVLTAAACAVLIARHLPRARLTLTWLGKRSLEIFILHFAIVRLLLPWTTDLPGSIWWSTPVVTMSAVAASLLLRRLLDPIAPWLFALPRRVEAWSRSGSSRPRGSGQIQSGPSAEADALASLQAEPARQV